MFLLIIKDAITNKTLATLPAEKYLVVSQDKQQFTKSFSSPDFVEQLGLLEFAKQQVVSDMHQLGQNAGEVK